MNKLVRESISFERTGNVKKSLGLGYEAKTKKIFNDLNIPDWKYTIKYNTTIVNYGLNFYEDDRITELPDNLKINGGLILHSSNILKLPNNLSVNWDLVLTSTKVSKLPNNLMVGSNLYLMDTKITELPNDLKVKYYIYVNPDQHKLINFIKNSKFKNKLKINK